MDFHRSCPTGMGVTRDGSHFYEQGKRVRDTDPRVKSWRGTGLPPAYVDTCFATDPFNISSGGAVATGFDAKGRLQRRYAKETMENRASQRRCKLRNKLTTWSAEGMSGRLDPSRPDDAAVDMLTRCNFRAGAEQHLKSTGSRGVTTLEGGHVMRHPDSNTYDVEFAGKSGVTNTCSLSVDSVAGRYLSSRQITGHERLFPGLSPNKLNQRIGELTGDSSITSKDLRTWQSNQAFIDAVRYHASQRPDDARPTAGKRRRQAVVRDALKDVAAQFHNTPAVLKRSYIFPELLDAAMANPSGSLRMPGPCGAS